MDKTTLGSAAIRECSTSDDLVACSDNLCGCSGHQARHDLLPVNIVDDNIYNTRADTHLNANECVFHPVVEQMLPLTT